MPLNGNAFATVGKDYYVHVDNLKRGQVKAEKGDYFIILRFNRALEAEEIEKCCQLELQTGEHIKEAILVIRGKESHLGYYVAAQGKPIKASFRDNDTVVDLAKLLK